MNSFTSTSNILSFTVLAVLFWLIGIFAAPYLKAHGYERSATVLYALYGKVCHQQSDRTFHVWNEPCAVCIRCSAIYTSFALGTLFIAFTMYRHTRILHHPLSKTLKTLLLITSIGLLLSDVILNTLHFHASTVATRIITGMLTGLTLAWYVVPLFIDALTQLRTTQRN